MVTIVDTNPKAVSVSINGTSQIDGDGTVSLKMKNVIINSKITNEIVMFNGRRCNFFSIKRHLSRFA
jgi:hypothetical protein